MSPYDPFSPVVIADPYPHYRWLRDEAPCHYVEHRDMWVVSRYEDVLATLRNTQLFSSNQGVGYERRPVPMMIAYDPPEHTRLRRIVAGQFTPRQVARLRPRIEKLATELLEPLLEAGKVDWIEQIAQPLPIAVIAELMGVPPERRADFKRWTSATVSSLGGAVDVSLAERMRMEGTVIEFAHYFVTVLEERRAAEARGAGADDLISVLLRAHESRDKLLDSELISFCVLLLVAGNETTTNLIGSGALALLEHPEQWRRVESDPKLVPSLIEEALRYDSPIQGFFRNTTADAVIAGTRIPAGSKVMVSYGSANRDPRRFDDPDTFDVTRDATDHLAFGAGAHICLGAHLARLEADVLTRVFLARARGMRREGAVERTENPLLRGLAKLEVSLSAR